jgi:hypothetical protein
MKRLSKEQDPANRCLDKITMKAVAILLGRFGLEMKEKRGRHVSRWN